MKSTIVFILAAVLSAQTGIVSRLKTEAPASASAYSWQASCGGLMAQRWSDSGGWKEANCMDMAESLANLRDYRNVTVQSSPNVADMLTYQQYAYQFDIDPKDFAEAQNNCKRLLSEGYAHIDILAQCRKTVAGVVPYGLKLRVK